MKMNRRSFFRLMGAGAVTVAAAAGGLPAFAAEPAANSLPAAPIDPGEDTDALFAQFAAGANDVLAYRLFTPQPAEDKLPLVLYLHGADAIGQDNIAQLNSKNAYSFTTAAAQAQHPCYVLAPQLPARFTAAGEAPTDEQSAKGWTDEEVQTALIGTIRDLVEQNGNIDTSRIYITGHSMGALGVWGMVDAYADVFAAAMPISGLWNGHVKRMRDVPIWIFHGESDSAVPLERETVLRDQLLAQGEQVIMTIYTAAEMREMGITDGHAANIPAYRNKLAHDWMFAQKKTRTKPCLLHLFEETFQ